MKEKEKTDRLVHTHTEEERHKNKREVSQGGSEGPLLNER